MGLGAKALGAKRYSAAVGALVIGLSGTVQAQSAGASVVFLPPASGDGAADTRAEVISGDGAVVYGYEFGLNSSEVEWRNGAPLRIDDLTGDYLNAASFDGRVLVGGTDTSTFADRRGFFWTREGGRQFLPDVDPLQPVLEAADVSSDGKYIAVTALAIAPEARPGFDECSGVVRCVLNIYRWSQTGGYEAMGSLGTLSPSVGIHGSTANGISGDGSVIIGSTRTLSSGNTFDDRPFRWQVGVGIVRLPFLSAAPLGVSANGFAVARDINHDGGTIVGTSTDVNGHGQAVYWRSGAITGLGFIPGTTEADFVTAITSPELTGSRALAVSADGTIIVGSQAKQSGNLAWRWTATTGMQDLNQIVRDAGLSLNGFVLREAVGISDSGAFITGNAEGPDDPTKFLRQQLGFVLQLAQITRSQLIVHMQLAGVTLTSIVNQTFKTEVLGTLNGQTVFTRSFTDRIDTASGASALSEARAALGVSALRRIVIGAPTLVSNTTTVTGTATNTVNVLTGTQVTTAVVNTAGPATVITGDLGICVTPAAANQNPTGCSLSGTPVAVPTGILNSNIFTNTIQSLTPTTTQTVNQLISAVWQVAAVGGNQFGTVHALVGPVAFERGDRLIGQLIARGNGGGVSGAASLADAELGDGGTTVFGGYFGNWSSIDADARVPVASVRGNTDGFVLGFDVALGPELHAGAAIDYGRSDFDVRDSAFPETLEMTHTQVALFAGWAEDGFAIDAAAAVGFGSVHTVLGTPTTPATADRDLSSFSIGAQAGYALALDDVSSLTLVAGVRHSSVELDSFTESGGPAPLVGLARTVSRTRVYGGVELTSRFDLGDTAITPRLYAHAAQDSGDASGVADLVFASAPGGSVLQAVGPGVGKTVMELGGSLDIAVADDVHFWAAYDGSFRDGARTHAARVGLSVRW